MGLLLVLLLLAGCTPVPAEEPTVEPTAVEEAVAIDAETTYGHVVELAGEVYAGRLTGTEGNELAMDYIEGRFAEYGLKTFEGMEDYRQAYQQEVVHRLSSPVMTLSSGETFEHLKDFRFRALFTGSALSGERSGKMLFATTREEMKQGADDEDSVLVIHPALGETLTTIPEINRLIAEDHGYEAILLGLEQRVLDTYPVSKSLGYTDYFDDEGPFVAYISPETYEVLAANHGERLRITAEDQLVEVTTANIVGYAGTLGDMPPLVIGAHLDHVGANGDGTYQPGALDNASGIAALLETARVLSGEALERPVVFVAFNGEEESLAGSRFFATHPPLSLVEGTEVINLDMVGSTGEIPLKILVASNESIDLKKALWDLAKELDIAYDLSEDYASDHRSFGGTGAAAVTLIHDDFTYLHSVYDTPDRAVDAGRLASIVELLVTYARDTGGVTP
jgi:hypothetical protein